MQRSFPSNVKFLNEHTMACNVSHLPIIWTWKLHLNKNLSSKELALHSVKASVKACSNSKYQLPVQDVGSGIKSKVLAFIVCCLRNLSGVKWYRNSYCFRLLAIPSISLWSRNEQLLSPAHLYFSSTSCGRWKAQVRSTKAANELFSFLGLHFPEVEFQFSSLKNVSVSPSTLTGPAGNCHQKTTSHELFF